MKLKVFILENNTVKRTRHSMVQHAVKDYLGNPKAKVEYDENGKPSIEGTEEKWYISVTTTGAVMLAAVADRPIGIDGEYLPRLFAPDNRVDYAALAERFFSEEEADYVRDSADCADRFVRVWTRKEAYVKCIGKSLAEFPNFSVVDGEKLVSRIHGVNIKKFGINFPGSNEYVFAIAGVE